MTEERAIYETERDEELGKARHLIKWQADRIQELEVENVELEYKVANLYEMLHGRPMK